MRKRAVVIDDDEGCRWFMSKALGALGYEVRTFPTTSVCVDRLRCACKAGETCADVILTDNQMPGRTGLEFVRDQVCKGCHCPNIGIMSGSWTEEQMREARDFGCTVFSKPVTLGDIREWLAGREGEAAFRTLKDFAFDHLEK